MKSKSMYETIFLNLYNDHEFKKNQQIPYYNSSAKTAVIVDSRFNPLMESVIRNFMYFLSPHGWNICIVSYSGYKSQIKSIFPNCIFKEIDEKYIFFKDNIPNITISNYNKIFLDVQFWKELPGEHILIFQTDCIMYRMFDDYFLEYDYCGANYYNDQSVFYGGLNGGCSLRKKTTMIECIEHVTCLCKEDISNLYCYKFDALSALRKHNRLINPEDYLHGQLSVNSSITDEQCINEDVFFSHACELLLKTVPDKIHRNFFAIEIDYNINTCFYHGWNKSYQSIDAANQIINHSPFLCKYSIAD